jgi:predicted nucleotidyltransferase
MKTITQAFEDFLQSLELTDAEREAASDQHRHMREQLTKRLEVSQNFLSGSYGRKTAIRPLNDIDVFLVLKASSTLHHRSAPSEVLGVVQAALKAIYPGKSPTIQSRSVNIEFSGTGIAYDVVPSFEDPNSSEIFWIPDCDAPEWIRTNPKVHQDLSTRANEAAGKKLKPLLKAVKQANYAHGQKARSFHLEVLSWEILDRDPGTYLDGLVTLLRGLAERISDPCPDPSGLGPDIRPSKEKLAAARSWLDAMVPLASATKSLADQGRTGEAHANFREIFGERWPEKGSSGKGGGGAVIIGGGAVDDSRSRFG